MPIERAKDHIADRILEKKNKRSIAMQIEYLIEQHIHDFEEKKGSIHIKE